MTELSAEVEAAIAAMPEDELTATLARLRSPEENLTPMQRAELALRRHAGRDSRRPKVSKQSAKESAADALRGWGKR